MLLMKVGKYENLQKFRNGSVYFSPVETFRNDGTLFRGDPYEGKLFIDTKKGFWINGIDFSSYIEEATESFVGSENVVIFCASILDNRNSRPIHPNGIDLYDDFYKEIRKFGQFAVVFDSKDLIEHIKTALENKKCASAWGPVTYCEKKDSDQVKQFYKERKTIYKEATIYFLKGADQAAQNEWRFAIDYIGSDSPIKRNENGSVSLQIEPIAVSEIIDLDNPRK